MIPNYAYHFIKVLNHIVIAMTALIYKYKNKKYKKLVFAIGAWNTTN